MIVTPQLPQPFRPLVFWTLGALCAASLSACGGGSDSNEPPSPQPPAPVPLVSTALDDSFTPFAFNLGQHGGSVSHLSELPDGKLLLVLTEQDAPIPVPSQMEGPPVIRAFQPNHVRVLRLLPDGTPDPMFGAAGEILIRVLGSETVQHVVPFANGSIQLKIESIEPCIQRRSGSLGTFYTLTCSVTSDSPSPTTRTAQKTQANALIHANGQLEASSIDLNALQLSPALETRSLGNFFSPVSANDSRATQAHVLIAHGLVQQRFNRYEGISANSRRSPLRQTPVLARRASGLRVAAATRAGLPLTTLARFGLPAASAPPKAVPKTEAFAWSASAQAANLFGQHLCTCH